MTDSITDPKTATEFVLGVGTSAHGLESLARLAAKRPALFGAGLMLIQQDSPCVGAPGAEPLEDLPSGGSEACGRREWIAAPVGLGSMESPPGGAASSDVLGLVHPALRGALSAARTGTGGGHRLVEGPRLMLDEIDMSAEFDLQTRDRRGRGQPEEVALFRVTLEQDPDARGELEGAAGGTAEGAGGAAFPGAERRIRTLETKLRGMEATIETLEASNRELQAANEELTARNAELDHFAHAASHDLRAPVRAVLGVADLARESVEGGDLPSARAALGRIRDAASRMGTLIDSLLMFASVGRGNLLVADVVLTRVMDQVLCDLALEIDASGATVTVVGDLPSIESDATMIRQVLQNLISNAIKFRGDEPPRIVVSTHMSGAELELRVQDNGMGFDPGQAERAFTPFQRLHGVDGLQGSGLGLSICRRVMGRLGGSISVTTAPGHGSTFILMLPLDQSST